MKEAFLHYVWQLQYFNKKELCTDQGDVLQIMQPGNLNTHAGPDFYNARIRIGDIFWAGTVEVHLRSSDWHVHHHQHDGAYGNVVLHVVWLHDQPIVYEDGTVMPTLELKDRVDDSLILQYRKLMSSSFVIPCSAKLENVPHLTRVAMLDRTLLQRLERKSLEIISLLRLNGNDWEETTYQLLASNFGFKINKAPFHQLARSLPYRYLIRHLDHPLQVEALLFGQAGFLKYAVNDDYHRALRKEYVFLASKYGLTGSELDVSQWKFLRLRPANFPTIRIAQFCSLLIRQHHLFSRIAAVGDAREMTQIFTSDLTGYWQTHYTFGSEEKENVPALGITSIQNILINTVAPLLTAYGKISDDPTLVDRACSLLGDVNAEDNHILREWKKVGWKVTSAFDSQALIELYHGFCTKRQCLQCAIGAFVVKPAA